MHRNYHLFVSFVFAVLVQKCTADTDLSSCPNVEPVPNLSIDNLLGIWYKIQSTTDAGPCVVYNFTKDYSSEVGVIGEYLVTEIEQHKTLFSSLYHEHRSTKELSVPDSSVPGIMDLHLPFTIGTTKVTVFITDYQHYLGIFTCKSHFSGLVHTWSAEILSRNPTLDIEYIDIVRTRLASNNVDPFSLSFVSQKDCLPIGTQGSVVKAATNIISNIGEQITNLVEDKDKQPAGQVNED